MSETPGADAPATDAAASAGEPGLERRLKRLEAILSALEADELELEKALALFEEGVTHVRSAERILAETELRVDELLGTRLPTLVIQGERDTMGRPEEFPPQVELAVVQAQAQGSSPAARASSPTGCPSRRRRRWPGCGRASGRATFGICVTRSSERSRWPRERRREGMRRAQWTTQPRWPGCRRPKP